MKVPDSGHEERMFACGESWTLDGQAGMSKEGDSPDYEYWRRLREHKVRSNRLSYYVVILSLFDLKGKYIFKKSREMRCQKGKTVLL